MDKQDLKSMHKYIMHEKKKECFMYKRYMIILLAVSFLLYIPAWTESKRDTEVIFKENTEISGLCPVLDMRSVERMKETAISEEDKLLLCKIVQAEAGCEDRTGKILVANVILNRMKDDAFPDTLEGVIYQQKDGVAQFSPVNDGSLVAAIPNEETIEAVEAALSGEDYSGGALYFMARQYADIDNIKWFDGALHKVLSHGGHEFYK